MEMLRVPYPPCRFMRKFTFEGAAVYRGQGSRDSDHPSPRRISPNAAITCTIPGTNICAVHASELTG